MKQFEENAASSPEIVRCHRAYFVNIHNVTYLENGAGKGEAHFSTFKGTIPVSKTYLQDIINLLEDNRTEE